MEKKDIKILSNQSSSEETSAAEDVKGRDVLTKI